MNIRLVCWPVVFGLFAGSAAAQVPRAPEVGGRTASLGQPRLWHWQLGLGGGAYNGRLGTSVLMRAEVGSYRSLVNPIASFAEAGLEGYAGTRGADPDGGLRALLRVPYLGVGLGADYNLRDGRTDMLVTARTPVRRGGVFQRGTMVRLNWYPLRGPSFTLGVTAPLGDPLAGRSRPARDYVVVAADRRLAAPYRQTDPALLEAIDSVRVSAGWVRRLVAPFLDHDARSAARAEHRTSRALAELHAHLAVRSVEAEVRFFHAALERAFGIASGNDLAGRALAARARAIVLEEILIPYDRLLGRKKRHDTTLDLAVAARGRFGRALAAPGVLASDSANERAMFVFQQLTVILERVRRDATHEWDDARLAWLPLQFGLLPEEHANQVQLDVLVERVTGNAFRERNTLTYVANLQFHAELLEMIRQTRDYHVLWIHDFPAITAGRLDWASAEVVHTYLTTLTARVAAYDSTGTLPSFFILLDQHYYEARHSRLLMTILENPLQASAIMPGATAQDIATMADDLHRLRDAVRGSRVLTAEAREYGDDWLRNRVSVHVNITNRADASFWGGGLISSVFGYPDDVMRDHRKVTFRDVREDEPDSGMAILTGTGVGRQYLGPGWDDRSLIVRGPVLADLKAAARDMLLSQGLAAEDIPLPLRLRGPATPRARQQGEHLAMLINNGTGYQPKSLNVAKAVLYSLMPPGSVFKIPDSLWNSSFFAALLTGAALRGGHVLIIAPALRNAPSDGFPQMARAHELFARLLLARDSLASVIRAAGGELRAGLYALPIDEHGFASRAEQWAHQADTSSFLQGLLPFFATAEPVAMALAGDSSRWQRAADSAGIVLRPKLHQKVQFMATPQLWRAVTASPEWPHFIDIYLRYRHTTYGITVRYQDLQGLTDSLQAVATRIAASARGVPGAASFAILGSQNQDYRGMFMDGEIGMLFTGAETLLPLVDLVFMAGTVTWIDDRATLDRLIPPVGEWLRRLARATKDGV